MDKTNYIYVTEGNIEYRIEEGSNKRQLKYKHPDYGPPYWANNISGKTQWLDEDYAKERHWYKDFIKNGGNNE